MKDADRGRSHAQDTSMPGSLAAEMHAAGLIKPAIRSIRDLPMPEAGDAVGPVLAAMRADERY